VKSGRPDPAPPSPAPLRTPAWRIRTLARLARTRPAEWPARAVGWVRRVADRLALPEAPEPGALAPLPVPRDEVPGAPDAPPGPGSLALLRRDDGRGAGPSMRDVCAHDVDVLGLPFDVRIRWEAGRLQELAWWATRGAPWAADEALAFLARHPPGRGLHWASSLEVGLRLISLAVIADARVTGGPRADRRRTTEALARAIAHHAAWVARHPSVGTSARNHRVGELCALAVAAAVLPDCPEGPAWRAQAATLDAVLRDQLHADGLGIEQSSHYLCFVLELGWIAWHCGVPNLADPLGRGLRALGAILDDAGSVVGFGDDDGGRAWPDAPGAAWAPRLLERLSAIVGPPPPPGDARFARAGLTVLRRGGCVVAFDHGPLGEPWLGGHGHDDPLALWLHLPDGPAIGGRGTGSYHDPAARRFHRSAAAHATVTVGGRGPSEPHEHPFLWRHRANATCELVDLDAGRVLARHDGYAREGIDVAREIRFVGRTLLVDDRIGGREGLELAWSWPLDPRLTARQEGAGIVVSAGERDRLTIDPPPGFEVELVRGGPRPGPGWHSATYGDWVEATTVRIVGGRVAPGRFLTRIGILVDVS